MNTDTPPTDRLHRAILEAMKSETLRIVDEEAKNAAKRVEDRVRSQAGLIATRLASHVNFQSMGNEVVITVRFPDRDKDS